MWYCIALIGTTYRGMERLLTATDLYTPKTRSVFQDLIEDYFSYIPHVDEKPATPDSFQQVIAFYRRLLPFDLPCEIIACSSTPMQEVYGYPIQLLGIDIVHDQCESLLADEINPAIAHLLNENGLCRTKQDVATIIPFQNHGTVEWKPYYVYRVSVDEPA